MSSAGLKHMQTPFLAHMVYVLILPGCNLHLLDIASLDSWCVLLRMKGCHNQWEAKLGLHFSKNSHGTYQLAIVIFGAIRFDLIIFFSMICSLHQFNQRDSQHSLRPTEHLMTCRRIFGGILHAKSLRTPKMKRAICYPFSFIIRNSKPVGHQVLEVHFYIKFTSCFLFLICYCNFQDKFCLTCSFGHLQDLVGLLISMLLLGDFSLVLLTLLQLYSISLLDFCLVLFILPLGILLPFPAGINALFSHGPRRSAGLARVYALWNVTSLINIVSLFLGFFILIFNRHP